MSSLRARLIAAAVIWILIGVPAGYWALSSVFHSFATMQFYEELDVHVRELERLTRMDADGGLRLASQFSDPRYDAINSGFYWEIRKGKKTALKSPSLADAHLLVPDDEGDDIEPIHKHTAQGPTGEVLAVEMVTEPDPVTGLSRHYIIGTDRRHLNEMIAAFNKVLAMALAAFALSMAVTTVALITVTLAPFRRLAKAFQDVRTGKTDCIEGAYPGEIAPIIEELNDLMASSRAMLQRARAQAGNLAHGLKSPLAIIADEAASLDAKGERAAAQAIIEQCRTMQRHIDHHIARARASAAAKLPGTATKIESALKPIIFALGRIHYEKDITISTNINPDAAVAVDPQDLNEILANVLDNAYKFAARRINISASSKGDDKIAIVVEDDGPGLPPEARDAVFEIGARWDESKTGGGLGLAIVKELTKLYDGECLLDNADLGGLKITLMLPSAETS